MQFNYLLKSLCFLLFASLLFVSCEKDDSVVEEVKEEEAIETSVTITIDDRSITTDAFALYCNTDGKEGLSISNNQELLGTEINPDNYNEGDFMFLSADDGTNAYTLGGAFFEASFTGAEFDILSLTTDLESSIDSNDGSVVTGSMEGDLLVFDAEMEPFLVPFSVTFNAEIVGVSTVCD